MASTVVRGVGAVACLVLVVCMAACAGGGSADSAPSPSVPGSVVVDGGSAPAGAPTEFMAYTEDAVIANPEYMNDLRKQADSLDSDYIRQVIADGVISAAEMNDAEHRAIECHAGHGQKLGVDYWLGEGGGEITTVSDDFTQDEILAIQTECDTNTGYEALANEYVQAVANPDAIDLEPYQVQCFKDYGLLDPSVTYQQYMDDLMSNQHKLTPNMPTKESDPGYQDAIHCIEDPLHYMKSSEPGQ